MPFVKGDPNINRKGRPKNAEPDLLRAALEKEGTRRGENFWDKVAEYAFRDKNIMIAVMKKFVPDSTISTIDGEVNFVSMPSVIMDGQAQELNIGSNDPAGSAGRAGEATPDNPTN